MKNKIENVLKNGDSFKITFYPQNINFDVDEAKMQSTTRLAKWDSDCAFISQPKTKKTSPYVKFFDVEKNQYRTATTMYRAVSIFINNQHYTWNRY
jgi:hypothetical protein